MKRMLSVFYIIEKLLVRINKNRSHEIIRYAVTNNLCSRYWDRNSSQTQLCIYRYINTYVEVLNQVTKADIIRLYVYD